MIALHLFSASGPVIGAREASPIRLLPVIILGVVEGSRSAQRARYVVGALERFCSDQGLLTEDLLRADLIEALCALGMTERRSSTRGTYRSVLGTSLARNDLAGRRLCRVSALCPPTAGLNAQSLFLWHACKDRAGAVSRRSCSSHSASGRDCVRVRFALLVHLT